jgi:hypothetical protein
VRTTVAGSVLKREASSRDDRKTVSSRFLVEIFEDAVDELAPPAGEQAMGRVQAPHERAAAAVRLPGFHYCRCAAHSALPGPEALCNT